MAQCEAPCEPAQRKRGENEMGFNPAVLVAVVLVIIILLFILFCC